MESGIYCKCIEPKGYGINCIECGMTIPLEKRLTQK